jgi:hypothetical protein
MHLRVVRRLSRLGFEEKASFLLTVTLEFEWAALFNETFALHHQQTRLADYWLRHTVWTSHPYDQTSRRWWSWERLMCCAHSTNLSLGVTILWSWVLCPKGEFHLAGHSRRLPWSVLQHFPMFPERQKLHNFNSRIQARSSIPTTLHFLESSIFPRKIRSENGWRQIQILFGDAVSYLVELRGIRRSRHKVTGLQGQVCCKLTTGSAFSTPVH